MTHSLSDDASDEAVVGQRQLTTRNKRAFSDDPDDNAPMSELKKRRADATSLEHSKDQAIYAPTHHTGRTPSPEDTILSHITVDAPSNSHQDPLVKKETRVLDQMTIEVPMHEPSPALEEPVDFNTGQVTIHYKDKTGKIARSRTMPENMVFFWANALSARTIEKDKEFIVNTDVYDGNDQISPVWEDELDYDRLKNRVLELKLREVTVSPF